VSAPFAFESLRRLPDVEAPNLFAYDASDRLVLDEAAESLAAAGAGQVVTIGDRYGALTLGAVALHGATGVRAYQDALSGERALANNAAASGLDGAYTSGRLDEELLRDARVVLVQLPKQLAELEEIADAIARFADPSVAVFAGGRIKHMTPTMNTLLAERFGEVHASLARQKSRVLVARGALRPDGPSRFPAREFNAELGLWVCASGGVFAGTKLDIGTRFLLSLLDEAQPDAATAIDLGCGSGILAAALAGARPGLAVIATDQSAAAVASATATMEANGLADRVSVVRDNGLASQPDASADLVVLNPPFHTGTTVDTGLARRLFVDVARVLRPGGELWTVFNSHLDYRGELDTIIGSTRQVERNAKFTVTASRRRPA
jgi:16S rRNA (guanine1207-N2)-methyltransferase